MTRPRIDLRSDTVTRPTAGMRQAMFDADVGDDVYGDDPTVNRLEAVAAERLGKEAALFVPSGTMANQLAIGVACRPGEAALLHQDAHPYQWEAGAAAMFWGVTLRPLPGARGMLDPHTVAENVPGEDVHVSPVAFVGVEDTANRGGGAVWPFAQLEAVASVAHQRGLTAHIDGARFFNACVASGMDPAARCASYDSISICLSKGLGAPVGSLLLGSRDRIHHARRLRKALGGGMRQAGILAAAALYALDHHVDRLAEDHRRATTLATGLTALGFPTPPPDTNLVFVQTTDAAVAKVALSDAGLACGTVSDTTLRLAVHLDLDDADIAETLRLFEALPNSARP